GANVIMMSKGMIRYAVDAFSPTTSLALLLSASANPGEARPAVIQIAQVEEASRLGADAVVLFTALGGEHEAAMIRILSDVGRESALLGIPLIAEAEFPTTYASVEELSERYGFEYLRRSVRLCAELGADIVKTNWPGDEDAFGKLVRAVNGVPVVLAGGSRVEDAELLGRMECAMQAGAIGCPDILQRRPKGAGAVDPRSRAGRRDRRARTWRASTTRGQEGRSSFSRLDPDVRAVPVVHGRFPEPL